LADRLWDQQLIRDQTVADCLASTKTTADFAVDHGNREGLDFIHRHDSDNDADIYFVASARREKRHERLRFRINGKQPEIWNAQTGEIQNAALWQDNGDGTTSVSVSFDPEGSAFVLFRKPAPPTEHIVKTQQQLGRPPLVPLSDLKIITAQYGTFLPDGLLDVTEILARRVKNNRLEAVASRGLFGHDPAPGYKKELRFSYQIGEKDQETSCVEQEAIRIDGSKAGSLKIKRAVFGKFSNELQGVPSGFYAQDVTNKIEAFIAAGRLNIPIDDSLIDKLSSQGIHKRLRIEYSIDGVQYNRSIAVGRTLNLARDVPDPKLVAGDNGVRWLTPYPGELTCKTSSGNTKTFRAEAIPDPIELPGPWDLSFPVDSKPPIQTTFNQLTSWSLSSDDAIRYFSGTATYQTRFDVPEEMIRDNISLELDLGSVHVMAEVSVNGKNLGILWKAPFRVGLDGVAQDGANDLTIKVTNLWPNRLIGDEQLPSDVTFKRKMVKQWPGWLLNQTARTSGRVGFAAYRHFDKESDLLPSGLLGPVIVRPYLHVEIAH
jgi:hypothetical protein